MSGNNSWTLNEPMHFSVAYKHGLLRTEVPAVVQLEPVYDWFEKNTGYPMHAVEWYIRQLEQKNITPNVVIVSQYSISIDRKPRDVMQLDVFSPAVVKTYSTEYAAKRYFCTLEVGRLMPGSSEVVAHVTMGKYRATLTRNKCTIRRADVMDNGAVAVFERVFNDGVSQWIKTLETVTRKNTTNAIPLDFESFSNYAKTFLTGCFNKLRSAGGVDQTLLDDIEHGVARLYSSMQICNPDKSSLIDVNKTVWFTALVNEIAEGGRIFDTGNFEIRTDHTLSTEATELAILHVHVKAMKYIVKAIQDYVKISVPMLYMSRGLHVEQQKAALEMTSKPFRFDDLIKTK